MIVLKKRPYKYLMDGVACAEKIVIGLLLLFDVFVSAANVFSRYVIHQNWSFAEEIVVAGMVLMSLIGAALCARERSGLINLTLFVDKLPRKARLIVEIVMFAGLVFFGLVMVYYGVIRCVDQHTTNRLTAALQIPEWYYTSFVPIGGALLVLHSLEHILDCFFAFRDTTPGDGMEEGFEA